MKNSNDTIGNRTRDLPTCSAVPQPTAPPRAPLYIILLLLFVNKIDQLPLASIWSSYSKILEAHTTRLPINTRKDDKICISLSKFRSIFHCATLQTTVPYNTQSHLK